MSDLMLQYRACGAECREDWLRTLANENGLPLAEVQRAADLFGSSREFGALVEYCACGSREEFSLAPLNMFCKCFITGTHSDILS